MGDGCIASGCVCVSVCRSIQSDSIQQGTHKRTYTHTRQQIFAGWIVETYGAAALRARGGVCDVAGGHGDVSVCLWCEYGVPCTVVEPRPVGLRRRQRKQVKRRGLDGVARLMCEMRVGRRFRPVDGEGEEGAEQARLREALEGCALVVGMHPDEATDAIVDVAHEYGKPFACVPVRVFLGCLLDCCRPSKRCGDVYRVSFTQSHYTTNINIRSAASSPAASRTAARPGGRPSRRTSSSWPISAPSPAWGTGACSGAFCRSKAGTRCCSRCRIGREKRWGGIRRIVDLVVSQDG